MDYMDELFVQREHFINTFYATKQNVNDNRTKLIACAYQLSRQQDSLNRYTEKNYKLEPGK